MTRYGTHTHTQRLYWIYSVFPQFLDVSVVVRRVQYICWIRYGWCSLLEPVLWAAQHPLRCHSKQTSELKQRLNNFCILCTCANTFSMEMPCPFVSSTPLLSIIFGLLQKWIVSVETAERHCFLKKHQFCILALGWGHDSSVKMFLGHKFRHRPNDLCPTIYIQIVV